MKDPGFAKFVLLINGSIPLAFLCWDEYWRQLGPDPTLKSIHVLGMTALIFLILTLMVTPVRKLTGWNWLSHFRRMLGLFAFFYASLHLLVYFVLTGQSSLAHFLHAVATSPYIIYGLGAWILMIPLALTSTNGAIKAMGARKWKLLHKLIYLTAILAAIHFLLVGKLGSDLAIYTAILIGLLLAYRVAAPLLKSRPAIAPRTS